MKMFLSVITVVLCCAVVSGSHNVEFPALDHIHSATPSKDQAQAVGDLIKRKIGSRASQFRVLVVEGIGPPNKDTFKLQNEDGTGIVTITGSSGVAAAWGFYYYLSQYCGCHVSWAGDQLNLPTTLPALPKGGITVVSNDRFRYYQNVCTVSYSFAWWNWSRWERELDWMAMNGINLPLAFTAQEAIWQRVFLKMGFSPLELDNHFGGVAFLAWSRMGNMHGWGGPLPASWHSLKLVLQHQILDRMRAFGMIPVLPAFSGYVPNAITRVFPAAKVTKMGNWCDFSSTFCCTLMLDVKDPLFKKFGKAFLSEYIAEFGTDHVYNTDTFNEMQPASSDPTYLKQAGRAVFDGMTAADPDAVWLMQGWLFHNEADFWRPAQAEALLTSVPQGRMIVLDLMAENAPQYPRLKSFYGQPFIWCMVHNFGGAIAMFGSVETINIGPAAGRSFVNSTMIGIGLTMEGINQNNVIYEFMLENGWRSQPRDLTRWFDDYALRRYGMRSVKAAEAWQIFKSTVYNCTDGQPHHLHAGFLQRPSLHTYFEVWFNISKFSYGVMLLADAMETEPALLTSSLYRYDVVDAVRQLVVLAAIYNYNQLVEAFRQRNHAQFVTSVKSLSSMLEALDGLLSSDEHFLLGSWLESAKKLATNDDERQLYEYNARNQITLWGPDGNILDYASKQWGGLVRAYYAPRWKLFFDELLLSWNSTFVQELFNVKVFYRVEQPFTFDRTVFPTTPTGDSMSIAAELVERYGPVIRKHSGFFDDVWKISTRRAEDEGISWNFRSRSSGHSSWSHYYHRKPKNFNDSGKNQIL